MSNPHVNSDINTTTYRVLPNGRHVIMTIRRSDGSIISERKLRDSEVKAALHAGGVAAAKAAFEAEKANAAARWASRAVAPVASPATVRRAAERQARRTQLHAYAAAYVRAATEIRAAANAATALTQLVATQLVPMEPMQPSLKQPKQPKQPFSRTPAHIAANASPWYPKDVTPKVAVPVAAPVTSPVAVPVVAPVVPKVAVPMAVPVAAPAPAIEVPNRTVPLPECALQVYACGLEMNLKRVPLIALLCGLSATFRKEIDALIAQITQIETMNDVMIIRLKLCAIAQRYGISWEEMEQNMPNLRCIEELVLERSIVDSLGL